MKKVINIMLGVLKYLLLLVAFSASLFIVLKMNQRLGKPITDSINIFIPYGILLLLYILNFSLDRRAILDNLFYNLTSCLVFSTNLVVFYRAVFDYNMLFNGIQKMGVNFNYFNDYLSFNRIMLYGLIIADIIFMFIPNMKKKNTINLELKDNKEVKGSKKEDLEVL